MFLLTLLQLLAVAGALSQQSFQGLQQGGTGPLAGSVFFKGLTWPPFVKPPEGAS